MTNIVVYYFSYNEYSCYSTWLSPQFKWKNNKNGTTVLLVNGEVVTVTIITIIVPLFVWYESGKE